MLNKEVLNKNKKENIYASNIIIKERKYSEFDFIIEYFDKSNFLQIKSVIRFSNNEYKVETYLATSGLESGSIMFFNDKNIELIINTINDTFNEKLKKNFPTYFNSIKLKNF
jgi:hypothetical protein